MATIYTNRNDNSGGHTTVDPNIGTTWVGGSVPLSSDQVYIVERRTTLNQSGITKWYREFIHKYCWKREIIVEAYFSIFGIELDILDNIPFQIMVNFSYRYPLINRIQDDGIDDGRLRCFSLQHGTLKTINYGGVPSTLGSGWNNFSCTFTDFASEEGKAAVYLNRSALNGYVDFANSSAYILTDYPDKIRVIGNTFNHDRVFDQFNEIRDLRPLSQLSNSNTAKFTKVKF